MLGLPTFYHEAQQLKQLYWGQKGLAGRPEEMFSSFYCHDIQARLASHVLVIWAHPDLNIVLHDIYIHRYLWLLNKECFLWMLYQIAADH